MRHYVEIERIYWERSVVRLDRVFDTDEEALEYAAVHKDEFEDAMDRQLIDFLRAYMYHKKNEPSE